MILTNSGDTIPDTSGGRISSMIGGDGGFVYGSNVCNAANTSNACGAYGSWSVGLGTYGFAVPVAHAGVVASRTYYSPSQSLSDYWLARKQVPGDTTFVYNTMTVPQYMAGNDFYLGAWGTPAIPTTGGGALNAQGGVINMQTGAINMNDSSGIATGGGIMNVQGGNIFMQGDDVIGGGTLDLGVVGKIIGVGTGATAVDNPSIFLKGGMKTGSNPLFQLNSDCSIAPTVPPAMFFATCNPVAQISGDVNIIGLLKAYQLFAGTFIYQGSDERLKNNIKELSDPLTDVMKLRPVSFTYKASGQANMGVIAQDLEKIYPQLVTKGEDGMKAVSYDSLIAPLIGSVQELKKENDELRVQLKDMIKHQEQTDYELSKLKQK
jgi:hypothetical protein